MVCAAWRTRLFHKINGNTASSCVRSQGRQGLILIDGTGFEGAGDYEEAQLFYPIADSFSEFIAMLGPEPE
jgi:hypothetical protein